MSDVNIISNHQLIKKIEKFNKKGKIETRPSHQSLSPKKATSTNISTPISNLQSSIIPFFLSKSDHTYVTRQHLLHV